MYTVWNDKSTTLSSKMQLMCPLVTSIYLYAHESWTLTAELQRRLQAMEISCYHKILCVSYRDHITNKEVHAKTQQAVGPHEDHLTIIKKCKLQWYGQNHLARQWKGEEDKADRRRGGKTISGNGQVWSSPSLRGQWRTGKKMEETGCEIICDTPTTFAVKG